MTTSDNGSYTTCRHCGKPPEPDGDHTCPCPHSDATCPDHPQVSERTRQIREQQRNGGGEITAVMVSACPEVPDRRTHVPGRCWQVCPVCKGSGLVSRPPGVAADQGTFFSTSTGPWGCQTCNGETIILTPDAGRDTCGCPADAPVDTPTGLTGYCEHGQPTTGREATPRPLVEAAWEMVVEQQAGGSPGWSMAKSWAWDHLREAVEPYLIRNADGDVTGFLDVSPPAREPSW